MGRLFEVGDERFSAKHVNFMFCPFGALFVFWSSSSRATSFSRISSLTSDVKWKLRGAHVGMFFKCVSMSDGRLEDG